MIHIAVCDDDPTAVDAHKRIAENCLARSGSIGQVIPYDSSEHLLSDITDDDYFFDLILLDIEMPQKTGMEIAGQIRPCLPNVRIIFITSHMEYAIDAFELSIFRYVPKNEIEKRLPAAVEDALNMIRLEEGKTYTIQTSSRLEKIPYRDIYCIERDGKNARITAAGGVSKVRRSLQQVHGELDAEEFFYIDRGIIVNMIHIVQIKDSTAILKNGMQLPISRSHLQDAKERINRYWGAHI